MTPHEAGLLIEVIVITCMAGAVVAALWIAWEAWRASRALLALISCGWCAGDLGALDSQCQCKEPCDGRPWCRRVTEASRG